MTTKAIGPTFFAELKAAGLVGLPFSWGADGSLTFSETLTAEQISAIGAVYAAHDPSKPDHSGAAQAALDKSDVTILRCAENGVAVPAAWAIYRAALRASVGGAPNSLPAQPAYPQGT
jgi:hypothetical protein